MSQNATRRPPERPATNPIPRTNLPAAAGGRRPFDLIAHHRDRSRRAEARADGLARELAKALRLLGLALQVAAGNECKPSALLQMLERIDELAQKPGRSIDDLAVLLRETAPDRVTA